MRLRQYVQESFGDEAGLEARYQELVRLVEEERGAVEAAFEEERAAQERKEGLARETCRAPQGKVGEMLLRQEMALDRSIDRKVRIPLTLRKEQERAGADTPLSVSDAGEGGDAGEGSPPGEDANARGSAESPKLGLRGSCAGQAARDAVAEREEPQSPNSRDSALLKPGQAGTESPAEENAPETSKSPEQSQNVIENKGAALEEINA